MREEHRLAWLNRSDLARRAPGALAVVPIGATEQHGPHLATGTDHFVVERVAELAAEVAADAVDVIVAPTIPYGFSAHHLHFGATISISTRTLAAFLEDVCRSLLDSGFQRLFILNGHGGNDELVRTVARQIGTERSAVIAATSYWLVAWDKLSASGMQDVGRLPGHAGAFESSLLRAIRPDIPTAPPPSRAVTAAPRTRYYPDVHVEDGTVWRASDGYSDDPSAAAEALGLRAVDDIVGAVAEAFRAVGRPAG